MDGEIGDVRACMFVDLGLQSGTLWATCNIGASNPSECGNSYAWGEIATKTTYTWETYKYANGKFNKLTKYCSKSHYGDGGFTDTLTILQPGDDPATAWEGDWHTPSKRQWVELLHNTSIKDTIQKGMEGCLFTSKMNGNTLFLPNYDRGYWSCSLDTYSPINAWSSFGCIGGGMIVIRNRSVGLFVRPVRKK